MKLQIKDRRTPQQKAYKAMRMARCGCMTQETERALYKHNKWTLSQWIRTYAKALDVPIPEAWDRYYKQVESMKALPHC